MNWDRFSKKSYNEFMIINSLQRRYDELTTMPIFERYYDYFMLLS